MPQMAPMSWILIYFYFILIMLTFMMKIYFYKMKKINFIKKDMLSKNEKNWKW
uniref:ATP synthase complex subunit 8 n=1 Tax=Pharnaciini sp. NS-2020 TaxID=2783690 RepID=A0A7T3CJ44_9NEOP|nr:ATP synthase F0 subunit 8 [Pharnaciini sp. NS-2020]